MVLSPEDDTVQFALEKAHSSISKEGTWKKAGQEAGRAFKSIHGRCGGWCLDESSEVRQEGRDTRTAARGLSDWSDVG